ncbi:Glutathione-dependent formaldehyde-activating enzyme/centromere protein V [Penicillium sp. IBT 31633x]|nr:Glutathione-dependent formaldehyde-activating enzyme/centromere protein V [Penicillium sp. IBT 31633x]
MSERHSFPSTSSEQHPSTTPRQSREVSSMGMKARCQCGKVQFTAPTDKPLKLWICHCTECQHQSSSAFGITATFPYFELPESASGLVSSYTRVTLKGREMECVFCKNCGARLFHRYRDFVPAPGEQPDLTAITSVKGGCLEDMSKEMLQNAVHIWCEEAIIDIPEGVEKWDQGPPQPNPLVT